MAHRSVPAPFLTKTYQLVDDPSTDDIISWNESGTTFVVWKTAEFAKDLLPNYFKHNNFSSFVRQLNTYGFRKTVPDKWEFANDNFRRGEKDLLSQIRRRKNVSTPSTAQTLATGKSSSPSNSGDDMGSTSTTSPDHKNTGSENNQFADLSDENEKLKRDNEMLSSELAQTKIQCDELVAFLTEHVKVTPGQINQIMMQGTRSCGSSTHDGLCGRSTRVQVDDDDDDKKAEPLKLFGVLLNATRKRSREGDQTTSSNKEIKAPWMKISA